MKRIKPIALKNAKILSNEEMKHLFGGSGGDGGLVAECNTNASCTIVVSGSTSYLGTCKAMVTGSSVSCFCEFSSGDLTLTGGDEACFKITP